MRCWRQSSPANRTKLLQKRRQEPCACRIRQAAGISQNIRYDCCTAERGFGGAWCTPESQLMPDLLIGAYSDGGSQVFWEDGERVFRRLDDNGKRAVLLVMPAADQPSRSSLDRLTHEYELRDEVDEAWAVRPLDLVRDAGRTMLVLEDAGEPLDRLLGAP